MVVFLHEHVYRSLLALKDVRSPPFFYDELQTLGYTDAFLLDQGVYAPLRLLGTEPFLALSLVVVVLSALSYVFTYLLLRRLEVSRLIAALAAVVVTFPNNLYLKSGHLQHFAVYFFPIIIYCALVAAVGLHAKPRRSYLLGAFSAWLLGMVFSTGFYMAWFFGFALLILLVIAAWWVWPAANEWWRQGKWRVIRLALIAGLGFIVAMAIFAAIYAPVVANGVERSIAEYLLYAPELPDLVNVGLSNLVWSDWIRQWGLVSDERLGFHEVAIALTPGLQVLLLASGLLALTSRFWPQGVRAKAIRGFVLGSLGVFLMLFVLTVKFDDTTLFEVVRSYIPGATAIRVGYRGMIVANLFAMIATALTFDRLIRMSFQDPRGIRRAVRVTFPLLLLVLLPVEQFNVSRPTNLSRTAEREHLSALERAPEECLTFYVAAQPDRAGFEVQIDGMMIALVERIPTLNGHSGSEPVGWDLDPKVEDYDQRAARWALNRRIAEGLCRVDVITGSWTAVDTSASIDR